ncbi:WAP four-disulfide core domain protein 18-like [Engystomops pustulosus]|uniref:WAP four-disulfide core domain protein 18-like n=1 Tax=Engystomops pustulosus TaxID=76066 RepID=UPI003AFA1B1E
MKLLPLLLLLGLTCVHGDNVTQTPMTTTVLVKPGKCPEPEEMSLGACFNVCNNDSTCRGIRKCCKTSCLGLQCKIPEEKPGSCPPPESVNGTISDPIVVCTSDSKCEETLKCCPTASGELTCQKPL